MPTTYRVINSQDCKFKNFHDNSVTTDSKLTLYDDQDFMLTAAVQGAKDDYITD